jgi:sterol desaturase/sphingolipid hydroxylase (fatty acid hydroxylase superfamily)
MPAFLHQQHIPAFLISLAWVFTFLVLLFLVFSPFEWLFARRREKFFRKGLGQDLGYYFINSFVPGFLIAVPIALVAAGAHAIVPWPIQTAVAAWPIWVRMLAMLVVGEIGFYWGHRAMHQIPFLWHFHAIHHSAEHVHFLTSSRAHPLDQTFVRLCGFVPAYALGVASPMTPTGGVALALVAIALQMWGYFVHSNIRLRLGPLEWLIATPGFHHWHHTLGGLRDRNYASMLPWLDMIFGTYHVPRKEWPSAYGIDAKIPDSLTGQLMYPLSAQPLRTRLPEPVTDVRSAA